MNADDNGPKRYLENLVQLLLSMALGVAGTYWLFNDLIMSAAAGLAIYPIFRLFVMAGDIAHIERELASFRNGEDKD